MINKQDSLTFLKEQPDYSIDINYSDPPYGLGSTVIIRPDGKPDYDKASDFMNKWDMPTGSYWEEWFKETYRTLKHGGYCIMFGMDRQLLLFKYYASLAGFQERQSLYWYFISNFPKASDLSKNLDKNAGAEREVIEIDEDKLRPNRLSEKEGGTRVLAGGLKSDNGATLTAPSTPLAKKYSGYKYSISTLKQTNETIMVFQKPYKTGSCMHDTLAYENGDKDCGCFALNIDGGRVPTSEEVGRNNVNIKNSPLSPKEGWNENSMKGLDSRGQVSGRYPAQTFCNNLSADILDKQSGIKTSGAMDCMTKGYDPTTFNTYGKQYIRHVKTEKSSGGCSKILHHCEFEKDEHDIYFYCPKVNKGERNGGCEDIKSNHPTMKPISLNQKILHLFKTPNPQRICFSFAGSGSEVIGGIKAGFTDWIGCELSEEYIKIAEARINYWTDKELSKLI